MGIAIVEKFSAINEVDNVSNGNDWWLVFLVCVGMDEDLQDGV